MEQPALWLSSWPQWLREQGPSCSTAMKSSTMTKLCGKSSSWANDSPLGISCQVFAEPWRWQPRVSSQNYVAAFVPSQGQLVSLGKGFSVTYADAELSKTDLYATHQGATATANLTCPKSRRVDGFARLLTWTVALTLKGKIALAKLTQMEAMPQSVWASLDAKTLHHIHTFGGLQVMCWPSRVSKCSPSSFTGASCTNGAPSARRWSHAVSSLVTS